MFHDCTVSKVPLENDLENTSTEANSNTNIVERIVLRAGGNERYIFYRPATKVISRGNSSNTE